MLQLRREKVELENALEQEQESLVNRLWRKMEKLEAEKRWLICVHFAQQFRIVVYDLDRCIHVSAYLIRTAM